MIISVIVNFKENLLIEQQAATFLMFVFIYTHGILHG